LRIAKGKTYAGTGIVVVVDVVDDVVVDDVVDVVVVDVVVDIVVGAVITSVFEVPAQPNRLTPATMREISLTLIPSP
jgi:hypothetical protein